MEINRRDFLSWMGGITALSLVDTAQATLPNHTRFLGARFYKKKKQYVATIADEVGRCIREVVLPGRGHSVIARPGKSEAVAIARRPGNFAVVFSTFGESQPLKFNTPSTRHFQGHATFNPHGNLLFTTENDFDSGSGVIGIYDAKNFYRRIGEIQSYGIGPHELAFMPDGKTLAIANGGILTHPDMGRAKLNITTMEPSLAYVDSSNGELKAHWVPPPGRKCKLSIRHLAIRRDGLVAYACQDQGPINDAIPLIGLHRPNWHKPILFNAPHSNYAAMNGYCGSLAWDTSEQVLAVSSPRGNIVTFWNARSLSLSNVFKIEDGCGVATGQNPGTFVLSSGNGVFMLWPKNLKQNIQKYIPWDNHLSRITN